MEYGFAIKFKEYPDLDFERRLCATVDLTVEKAEKTEMIFSFTELTHYDIVYMKAMRIAFEYLLIQQVLVKDIKIDVINTYWFDIIDSPPIAVAYAAFFALKKTLEIDVPLVPYFDVFNRKFVFPNIDNKLLTFEKLSQ